MDDLDDIIEDWGAGSADVSDRGWGALEAGAAYAFFRHGQDRQTEELIEGLRSRRHEDEDFDPGQEREIHVRFPEKPKPKLINAIEGNEEVNWKAFVGQENLKRQLKIHMISAQRREEALEHVLLASGMPGVGKTHMAKLIASEMGTEIIMLVPPFHRSTLHEAAKSLSDHGILFIDEIHKLADHGKRAAEDLLHLLEEKVLYLDEGKVTLNDITVIGATTDVDKLPETVIDRFPIKPYYRPYSTLEMYQICCIFKGSMGLNLSTDLTMAIAKASRRTPRVCREMVIAARDLTIANEREPTPEELLAFKETEPNGLTRAHIDYLKKVYTHFRREMASGEIVYVAGESTMMAMLRETKQGIQRLERFLLELGLLDRSPMGRRLTDKGIQTARSFIARERRESAA